MTVVYFWLPTQHSFPYFPSRKSPQISSEETPLRTPMRPYNTALDHIASVLNRPVMSNSLGPHGLQPAGLLCPWDFPGKNTGVDCHFLLQGIFSIQESPGKPYLAGYRHISIISHQLSSNDKDTSHSANLLEVNCEHIGQSVLAHRNKICPRSSLTRLFLGTL